MGEGAISTGSLVLHLNADYAEFLPSEIESLVVPSYGKIFSYLHGNKIPYGLSASNRTIEILEREGIAPKIKEAVLRGDAEIYRGLGNFGIGPLMTQEEFERELLSHDLACERAFGRVSDGYFAQESAYDDATIRLLSENGVGTIFAKECQLGRSDDWPELQNGRYSLGESLPDVLGFSYLIDFPRGSGEGVSIAKVEEEASPRKIGEYVSRITAKGGRIVLPSSVSPGKNPPSIYGLNGTWVERPGTYLYNAPFPDDSFRIWTETDRALWRKIESARENGAPYRTVSDALKSDNLGWCPADERVLEAHLRLSEYSGAYSAGLVLGSNPPEGDFPNPRVYINGKKAKPLSVSSERLPDRIVETQILQGGGKIVTEFSENGGVLRIDRKISADGLTMRSLVPFAVPGQVGLRETKGAVFPASKTNPREQVAHKAVHVGDYWYSSPDPFLVALQETDLGETHLLKESRRVNPRAFRLDKYETWRLFFRGLPDIAENFPFYSNLLLRPRSKDALDTCEREYTLLAVADDCASVPSSLLAERKRIISSRKRRD